MEQVTQAASQLGQPHSNEVVPHKISNHDLLVQAQIWAGKDVGWLNLNDTQDQLNMKLDLHKVEKVVQSQVELLSGARSTANAAVSQAESAQKASNVNQAAISNMDSAQKATQQEVDDAVKRLDNHDKSLFEVNSAVTAAQSDIATQSATVAVVQSDVSSQSAAVTTIQTDLSNAKQQIKDADSNITAVGQTAKSAYAIASDANSNAIEVKATAQSAYAVASDAKSNTTQIKVTADSAMALASDANSNAVEVKATAQSAYTVATNAQSEATQVRVAANSAVAIATDAKNDVTKIGLTANSAVALASDAKSNAAQAVLNASGLSTTVSGLSSTVNTLSAANKALSDDMKNKADVGTVNQSLSNLTTSVNQAKDALTSKADKLDVDKLTKTVTDTQSLLEQKAGQLSSTITQVNNKAGQNSTLISNLTQTIDGLQSTVKGKAEQSVVSQLSDQLLQKVSVKDYQTEIALLQKNLNLRVSKGDLISQINLEAGGNGLISVKNGKGKLLLDADSVIFGHQAFIPSAAITNIEADKIRAGTLDAGAMRVVNLTADSIHGGTLDVGDMHVKNFSANDITTGTLTGIDIISKGDKGKQYEMIGSTLKWTDDDKHHASIGQNEFSNNYTVDPAAFSLLSDNGVFLGNVRFNDKGEPDVPTLGLDNSSVWINNNGVQIASDAFHVLSIGAGQSYYDTIKGQTYDTQSFEFDTTNAVQINLNPGSINVDQNTGQSTKAWNSDSQFRIQKDDHIGAYFGDGNNGNQITFNFGGNDGGFNVNGNQITFNLGGGGFNVNGNQITFNLGGGGFNVNGPIHLTGAKNAIVETRQGWLAINAYETAEYYFGDIGENNTGNAGQVVIGIDRIFNETVNTDIQYQVFVTPYSNAHVWVEKRYNNRFVVCSDKPNAEFGWELKAKRKGYEDHRLRRIDVDFSQMDLKGEN